MEAVTKAKEIERLLAESEWIRGLARGLVGDSHRAEDLAQEAHLAALRAPAASQGSMRPWLATVSRNAARMWFRSEGARRGRETDLARIQNPQTEPSPEERLGQLETQEELSRHVRELPAELSDVILLHFFEGLSLQEIAQLRDIPAGTVRWRKKRGIECLRERLDTTHGGDRQAWLSALAPLVAPDGRTGTQAATGAAATSGLLAPWIAMTLTWKLISIGLFAALFSIPFVKGEPAEALEPGAALVAQAPELQPQVPLKPGAKAPLVSLPVADRTVLVRPDEPAVVEPDPAAPPVTRIRLRVVDAGGLPIAGASVRPSPSLELEASHRDIFIDRSGLELAALAAQMLRTTGADGVAAWESDLLREDGVVDFRVEGPRFGVGNLQAALEVGSDVDLGDVTLSDAGAVKGRVLDSNGRGLNLIRVCAQPVERNGAGEEQRTTLSMGEAFGLPGTRSRRFGSFELLGLAPGEYRMCMQTTGPGPLPMSEPFWVVAGLRTDNIQIRGNVAREERVPQGLLIQGADGEPLPSAFVKLELDSMSSSGVVHPDGHWGSPSNLARFEGGRLEVSDRSFQHHSRVIDSFNSGPNGLVVRLEISPSVQRELVVQDQDGQAIDTVVVSVSAGGIHGGPGAGQTTTQVSLPDASRGPCAIKFYAKGYLPLNLAGVDTNGLPDPWVVALQAIPGIQGHVLAEGAPVKKAKVTLFRRGNPLRVKRKGNAISSKSFSNLEQVPSDSLGAFHMDHSHAGAFVLVASARGYADALIELPNYEASLGAAEILFSMDDGGEVKGTIFDSRGQPMSRAYIVLNHKLHKLHRKRTGRDGTFRFRHIPAGQWFLRVVEDFDSGMFATTIKVAEDWSFPINCTVVAGKTTQLDLHLPAPDGASISGVWNGAGEWGKGWTATASSRNGGLFGGDPFENRWSSEQSLSPGQAFDFPVQLGRAYHLRLTHDSMPGILAREISANGLPAQVTPPSEFTIFRAHARSSIDSATKAESLIVEWQQGAWSLLTFLAPNEDGTFGPILVPSGTLKLLWKVSGSDEIIDLHVEAKPNEVLDAAL